MGFSGLGGEVEYLRGSRSVGGTTPTRERADSGRGGLLTRKAIVKRHLATMLSNLYRNKTIKWRARRVRKRKDRCAGVLVFKHKLQKFTSSFLLPPPVTCRGAKLS